MLSECLLAGPLLTPGFVAHELPRLLTRNRLLSEPWLPPGIDFPAIGGPILVLHHIVRPLAAMLGYDEPRHLDPVTTREGAEDGGHVMRTGDGTMVRVWAGGGDTPLDTPSKRGAAARSSLPRIASRVLRASGEYAGLITNGIELRLLLCDPSGPDSHITSQLTRGLESSRVIAALSGPRGIRFLPDMFDAARLYQTAVTKTLRSQARAAIEAFLQSVLDHQHQDMPRPDPNVLWRQALTVVYRLLFILKLESAAEPGRGFSFAVSEAWRTSLSPNRALGPLVRRHLDFGHDTGSMLEDGLRILFAVCRDGLTHGGLSIAPLGGGLFDPATTTMLDGLRWGERAVALLLDRLLWTTPKGQERARVHYGSLDVEELGRVYESLLDLEPAIAATTMTRMRRGRLESVVPDRNGTIPAGRFFTRTGLGRRAGGSYYTPHGFVLHLVRETLTALVAGAIAHADPAAILAIKVIDPAMGSGHFLVEACRFLADALYEACRRADGLGTEEARARIDSLPDPDRLLSAYLPRRSRDASDLGPSRARALAICRRLVVVHCLYGIDQDPLAVELAKLSLWLESFAEGLPLTFLDHRLIVGDSIAGPFAQDLVRLPVGGAELDPLLAGGVADQLRALTIRAMEEVRRLEASVGRTIGDVIVKQAALKRLDELLAPLRGLARAWSGAVRTSAREANDAFLGLARSVVETGALPDVPHPHQAALLTHGARAVPLDLMFPEVFRPDELAGGFHAVLGNPPWDVVHYQTKEYLAAFDPDVMDAPTKRERETIERALLRDPAIRHGFDLYKNEFVERKRLCDRMFPGSDQSGSIDLFQVFVERMLDCVAKGGAVGLVVPSAFHANEGTAHLRRRILNETSLESCFTFENRRKWFDIHGRLKFTLLVTRRTGATAAFRCGYYLDSLSQMTDPDRVMVYDRDFVKATGGDSETFLELNGATDLRIAKHMFVGRPNMRGWMERRNISFGREAHMTDDSHRFTPIARLSPGEGLPLHEGKTFHQFTDRWKSGPRYGIRFDAMKDKPAWTSAAAHYRLAFREIARAGDERTLIAAIVPPGHVFGHKGTCEKTPWERPNSAALTLLAVLNSFTFDWCVRRKIAASVSLFMLHACPAPVLSKGAERFLAHGALRLSCGHEGYDGLWREQLGPEATNPGVDRTLVRAEMDAVVAREFGLKRDDYRHILSGFSHKSESSAPEQCLAAFDRIAALGARAFYRLHDPFARIPLNPNPSSQDQLPPPP